MNQITILFEVPAIISKDHSFDWNNLVMKPGSIVLLPEDAILVIPPNNREELK